MKIISAHSFSQRMNIFLYSPAYFVLMGGLTILSNVFCQELFSYTVMLLLGMYICLFGRDLLPLLPIFICCNIIEPTPKKLQLPILTSPETRIAGMKQL